jgi:hypothetical protein
VAVPTCVGRAADDADTRAQAANLPVVSKELFETMSQRAGAVTKAREDKEKAREDKYARRGASPCRALAA